MNTILQTPTNNLQSSIDFYSKLGFTVLSKKSPTIVSDRKVFIEINDDRFARAGVKMYRSDWSAVINKLEQHTSLIQIDNGYVLNDGNGVWVYLIEEESPYDFKAAEASTSALGSAAGISLESIGIEQSITIWELLGFSKTMGNLDQGWISFENDDKVALSIMKANVCPHLFFNPSLSYFNGGKNEKIIANIRKLNIPITEEITHFNAEGIVDNIIIRDPGGLGFFIFND